MPRKEQLGWGRRIRRERFRRLSRAYSVSVRYPGAGNIDADPLFVNVGGGNFHLSSGSPCIDTGTASGAPATDIEGNPRPQSYGFDMGAYEGTGDFDWVEITNNASWMPRYNHETLAFGGKLYVFGGSVSSGRMNDVWFSLDGLEWTESTPNANWPPNACASSCVFDSKIWQTGGLGSPHAVWYSSDGIVWNQMPTPAWPERVHHSSLGFDGRLWILGGDAEPYTPSTSSGLLNDVWYSLDGSDWTMVTEHADWTSRRAFSVATFDGKLWIMGGETPSGRANDVWWSDNGLSWNLATSSAPWTPRNDHNTVVFNDKMWILGGFDGAPCNDVWWSEDGVSWTRVVSSNVWSPRIGTATVFDDRMWILGGRDEIGVFLSDVWASIGTTSGKKGYEYQYDAVSRLTEVNPNNGVHISYAYDRAGNRLQKRVYSDLEVSAGPANPSSGGVANSAVERPMLQLLLSCAAGDALVLRSLTLATSGTGNDATALSEATLWLDADGDGVAGGGDTQLGSTSTIAQDDGALLFSNVNQILATGMPVCLLVTYTLNGTAGQGQTFNASLAALSGVRAVRVDSGLAVTALGRPVSGATVTISTDTVAPTFAGLVTAAGSTRSAALSWDAATDPSAPITYSIWVSTESFAGTVSGDPAFQTVDTAITVPNLTNGKEYFFVVRAQDAAGNREANTVERSAIPEAVLHTLTLTAGPNGAVSGAGDLPYEAGTQATVFATPDGGYQFGGWTGDIPAGQENANPLALAMDGDRTVTANFGRSVGTVVVSVNTPAGPWSFLDGDGASHSGTGSSTLTGIATGMIGLTWQELAEYISPVSPAPQSLTPGGAVIFSGSYAPIVTFAGLLPDYRLYTGDALTLQVLPFGGLGQLHYRWLFEQGKADPGLVGGDSDTLSIPSVQLDDGGAYTCQVTDSTLAVYATNTAVVEVRDHLVITQEPTGGAFVAGDSFTLSVQTTGGYEPLRYQWEKDGESIEGATGATLPFNPVQTVNAGTYSVLVTDANSDAAESTEVELSVDTGIPVTQVIGLLDLALAVVLLASCLIKADKGEQANSSE